MISNNSAEVRSTQPSPKAMSASSTALPVEAPATVRSAARVPLRAAVAMMRVTIGPGVRNSTTVMRRKAVKR